MTILADLSSKSSRYCLTIQLLKTNILVSYSKVWSVQFFSNAYPIAFPAISQIEVFSRLYTISDRLRNETHPHIPSPSVSPPFIQIKFYFTSPLLIHIIFHMLRHILSYSSNGNKSDFTPMVPSYMFFPLFYLLELSKTAIASQSISYCLPTLLSNRVLIQTVKKIGNTQFITLQVFPHSLPLLIFNASKSTSIGWVVPFHLIHQPHSHPFPIV